MTDVAKRIFFAFTGPDIKQEQPVIEMSSGYECWNLKKFLIDDFIAALQQKIPPLNKNVLGNYRAADADPDPDFGIREKDFAGCSWGLLLPEGVPKSFGAYAETLFVLNLYSPHFLYPVFHASDFGISRPHHQHKNKLIYFHDQNQSHRFASKSFVGFHTELISESVYSVWQADRVSRWREEDWRLFTASFLFSGLEQYENSKQVFGWQRESADLATILEALFTAEHGENTEISYRLRKRVAVLLGLHIPEIEKDIRDLYKQRSAFVHGSFFMGISEETKVKDGMAELPHPPFDFLYRQKENVRRALAAYLYLNKIYRTDPNSFSRCANVLQILERAIINIKLRSSVETHAAHILGLIDNPSG